MQFLGFSYKITGYAQQSKSSVNPLPSSNISFPMNGQSSSRHSSDMDNNTSFSKQQTLNDNHIFQNKLLNGSKYSIEELKHLSRNELEAIIMDLIEKKEEKRNCHEHYLPKRYSYSSRQNCSNFPKNFSRRHVGFFLNFYKIIFRMIMINTLRDVIRNHIG